MGASNIHSFLRPTFYQHLSLNIATLIVTSVEKATCVLTMAK